MNHKELFNIYKHDGYIELRFFPFTLVLHSTDILGVGIAFSIINLTFRFAIKIEENL